MRNLIYALICGLCLSLTACGGGESAEADASTENATNNAQPAPAPPPAPPKEVNWNEIESRELEEDTKVIFEAVVGDLPSSMSIGGGYLRLNFYPRRNQKNGYHLSVKIPTGSGPNTVKSLPESYYPEDLQITADDGSQLVIGDKVRIEGSYSTSSGGVAFDYVDMTKIEKIDAEFDEAIFETAIKLTDEVIEDTTILNHYGYIDARLKLGMFMSGTGGSYTITAKETGTKHIEFAFISIGEGPGQVQALPDNFTAKDFVVRDYTGKTHKGEGKFRLYGTFSKYEYKLKKGEIDGSFKVEEIRKM